MEIVRYRSQSQSAVGLVRDGIVHQAHGDPFGDLKFGASIGPIYEMNLLPPVVPNKIIAVGLNYQDHIEEDVLGRDAPEDPRIFLKPPTALIGHEAAIVLPQGADPVDAEAEVAAVIGRQCRNVRAADAYHYILGLTVSNDVSARNYQYKDGQILRAKGFDTFAPLGPSIMTDIRADDLAISSRVNGKTFQSSSTRHLIFDIPFLVEFISRVMTLLPGDVIMTGTPAGPPTLKPGDVCEIEVEGIGTLRNPVVAEEPSVQ